MKYFFSFVLNKVFVGGTKPNLKTNKTGFISYSSDYPSLNSRVKNKTGFEFLFYVRFDAVN